MKNKNNSFFMKKRQAATRSYFIVLALLIFLGSACYLMVQNTLLKNAHEQGMNLARRYCEKAQNNLASLDTLLSSTADAVDQNAQSGWSEKQLEEWILAHLVTLQETLERDDVVPYAVLNGNPVALNPSILASKKDPTASAWYQLASNADHAVIYTDVYNDPTHGKSTLTMAQQCQTANAVIAFDIFPETFLPRSYFHKGSENDAFPIQAGFVDHYDAWIADSHNAEYLSGNDAGSGGLFTIITLPHSEIFVGLDNVVYAAIISLALFFAAFVWISLRDRKLNTQMERINETVQVLGNSYYAIYRINFSRNTYEIIKGSDYISSVLPPTGDYSLFLRIFRGIIEDNAYEDFVQTFSLKNLKDLAACQIQDFGGDFRRWFDNSYRWVNVRVLFDEVLRDDEAVLCFRDIEAEKKQQLQEKQLLETALESSRRSEKNQLTFFNNMSHDMRTPLNAIIGLTRLMEQYKDQPEKIQAYLSRIRFASRQLLELVNDILDMSRLEQGQLSISNQKLDLTQVIRQCTDSFQPASQSENKPFHIQISIQNRLILGDPFRLAQILNNLLSNAFKYTERGDSVTLSVKQLSEGIASKYIISVSDTGIGMSEEFLERLFEPYSREVRFFSRQISGTGLGLPIVKSLVNQMNGQINVKSRLGEGTTFTIVVPFRAVSEASEGEKRSASGQSVKTGQSDGTNQKDAADTQSQFSLKGKKILLAEDNEINMEISTELLSLHGIEVTQAWNGKEALEQFEASAFGHFDAILMDMQMPAMDGCTAAKAIRSLNRPDAASVPIVAVTANAFAEDIAATEKAGMDAHVAKPIDFASLCGTLEKLLNGENPE